MVAVAASPSLEQYVFGESRAAMHLQRES
eukprot:SAG11_NODE_29104_length_314_cov_0.962791_1_plen_28_part_10